jgi:hypothetical protein
MCSYIMEELTMHISKKRNIHVHSLRPKAFDYNMHRRNHRIVCLVIGAWKDLLCAIWKVIFG